MCLIKDIKTVRLTGQRYILLTSEQWVSFLEKGCFAALIFPSYSLKESDVLYLKCDRDPIRFTYDNWQQVTVLSIDNSHKSARYGGYLKVEFSLLNKVR